MTISSERVKALARHKYESYKQSDIDKSLALCPAFTDFKISVEYQIVEGNQVTSYWVMRGKHTGEYLGIPASGKDATLTGMAIDSVTEAKVTGLYSVMDFEGFLQQLRN